MEELSATFHGASIFTKLDLRNGYLQVPLAEESRHLTAFVTHDGVFQYRRTCFGLSSAPSAFQKIISTVISGIDGTINYLDDIVVSGPSKEIHDARLQATLQRLDKHNLVLNREKCSFGQPSIEFLGLIITKEGAVPTSDNIKSITAIKAPANTAEVSSFLGMTNYYSKFVSNYSELTEPLRRLLRKGAAWECRKPNNSLLNLSRAG